jgi:hypothetical protein
MIFTSIMKPSILVLMLACVFFAGCKSVRSISHSGYRAGGSYVGSDPGFEYRGELSEFDVLGIMRREITSEAEIQRALDTAKPIKLRSGASLVLIQSGAQFPDAAMVSGLSRYFTVAPFSGVPPLRRSSTGLQTESLDPESYAKSLRLTAARGGNDFIVCYWGVLESESERLPTKTVSWVPIVNWVLPDEVQHARIRLKMALIDVRSGHWTVFSPKAFESGRLSISPRRSVADQKQVEALKQKAYEAGVKALLKSYSEVAMAE